MSANFGAPPPMTLCHCLRPKRSAETVADQGRGSCGLYGICEWEDQGQCFGGIDVDSRDRHTANSQTASLKATESPLEPYLNRQAHSRNRTTEAIRGSLAKAILAGPPRAVLDWNARTLSNATGYVPNSRERRDVIHMSGTSHVQACATPMWQLAGLPRGRGNWETTTERYAFSASPVSRDQTHLAPTRTIGLNQQFRLNGAASQTAIA